jgi:hypothetical protein
MILFTDIIGKPFKSKKMAHLDFKVTMWRKLHIPDEMVEEVIEQLKNGDCDTPYDIVEELGVYFDTISDDEACEEPMLPSENNGASTQELYNSDGDMIYQNGTDY